MMAHPMQQVLSGKKCHLTAMYHGGTYVVEVVEEKRFAENYGMSSRWKKTG